MGEGSLVHYEHLLESDMWKAMAGYANKGMGFGVSENWFAWAY